MGEQETEVHLIKSIKCNESQLWVKVWVGCEVPHAPGIITHLDARCL